MEPPTKRSRENKCSNVCAVKFCKTNSLTQDTSLFRFPKEIERCREWIEACGCQYLLRYGKSLHSSMYRVCSLHFEEKTYIKSVNTSSRRLLNNNIIPTLKLPIIIKDMQTSSSPPPFEEIFLPITANAAEYEYEGLKVEPKCEG